MKTKRWFTLIVLNLVAALLLAGCGGISLSVQTAATPIKASGTISADSVQVAPEVGGKVVSIKVAKGDTVKAGDELFRLDDQLAQAQVSQADAAVKAAQAALDAAKARTANAQAQYDQTVLAAQMQDQPNRTSNWKTAQADKVVLPAWYFDKSEQIDAINKQLDSAQKNLDTELANLDRELKNASNSDFTAAEKRLAVAQQAYTAAQKTLDEAKAAKDIAKLEDAAQKLVDSAQSELDAAQKSYDQMLSTDAANRVREARARVAVARENQNNLQDALNQLKTGGDSVQVTVAKTALDQARSAETQTQASLTQAQAALKVAQIQLDKTVVKATSDGIVLSRPVNPGEFAGPGSTVVEIGSLDPVTLTLYIPESEYGQIKLGQKATVTADSFAGKTFDGTVTHIADQAEFTPRNVQTAESRSTTVYKVEITIANPGHELKPGMPADASLTNGR